MKRRHLTILVLFVGLFAILLGGCASDTPLITPGPGAGGASGEAAVKATPTPLPDNPTIQETLTAGLAYVQNGFKLKMPPPESFSPAQPPALDSVQIEQAFASGPWLVAISPVTLGENGLTYRTIIITNDSEGESMSWWGQVDAHGVASKIVFSGMPRPDSSKVKGMVGKIVQLPRGSAYKRYFENEKGQRFGIATNKEAIEPILEYMTEEDGLIQVWGELRYAVDDYNGRRILVRNYDLKNVEPEEILGRAQNSSPEADAGNQDNTGNLGAFAIVYQPKPTDVIHGQVQVTGEVDYPTSDQIIIRVEYGGQTLGEKPVMLDAPQNGVSQFSAVVPFADTPAMDKGRVAIYAPDATTGQPVLLGWQEVRLAGDVGDKSVTITKPEQGAEIRGKVKVMGTAANIPNNRLLVRVEDTAGVVMGQSKAKVGGRGNWGTLIQFKRPKTVRPGVIAVYYVNSDDNSLTLLAMTPVKLKR